jgi:protein SSD1
LTDTSVAILIACSLPEQALLRKHDAPAERRIDNFVKRAAKLGYKIDGSSAGALQTSFADISDAEAGLCLELLRKKAMTP